MPTQRQYAIPAIDMKRGWVTIVASVDTPDPELGVVPPAFTYQPTLDLSIWLKHKFTVPWHQNKNGIYEKPVLQDVEIHTSGRDDGKIYCDEDSEDTVAKTSTFDVRYQPNLPAIPISQLEWNARNLQTFDCGINVDNPNQRRKIIYTFNADTSGEEVLPQKEEKEDDGLSGWTATESRYNGRWGESEYIYTDVPCIILRPTRVDENTDVSPLQARQLVIDTFGMFFE